MLVIAHYYQKLKLLAYNSADLERFFHVPGRCANKDKQFLFISFLRV